MHALTILHGCVGPLLDAIHRRRLAVLFEAVAATVSGPRLTLTEIGRRFGGGSHLRHRIKRADRLLGNRHLQRDSRSIYGALGRMLLAGVPEPLIVIDWSDLKEDQSLHLLRVRYRRVGAQQSAAGNLRAGAPAQAGTPGQDDLGPPRALEEEPASGTQCS